VIGPHRMTTIAHPIATRLASSSHHVAVGNNSAPTDEPKPESPKWCSFSPSCHRLGPFLCKPPSHKTTTGWLGRVSPVTTRSGF
jgi:hypothetical protein